MEKTAKEWPPHHAISHDEIILFKKEKKG